ncbi:MAG: Rab family GTPase [Candidatus Heimdallarchaeota archaeon]
MVTIGTKIVMCGDYAVGKTTFVQLFLGGTVLTGYRATVGVDIGKKDLKVNSHNLIMQIWDLSGQQAFSTIRKQFYARADGAVLVYDCSRRETFENVPRWMNEVIEKTGSIPCVLVANKIDLRNTIPDPVTTSEGMKMSETLLKHSGNIAPLIEASALYLENNLEPFQEIGRKIVERKEQHYQIR